MRCRFWISGHMGWGRLIWRAWIEVLDLRWATLVTFCDHLDMFSNQSLSPFVRTIRRQKLRKRMLVCRWLMLSWSIDKVWDWFYHRDKFGPTVVSGCLTYANSALAIYTIYAICTCTRHLHLQSCARHSHLQSCALYNCARHLDLCSPSTLALAICTCARHLHLQSCALYTCARHLPCAFAQFVFCITR